MTLTRYNNALSALLWPLVLFGGLSASWRRDLLPALKRALPVYAISAVLVAGFKILPSLYNAFYKDPGNYDSRTMAMILDLQSPLYYGKRVLWVLFGIDWGLIFVTPFFAYRDWETWGGIVTGKIYRSSQLLGRTATVRDWALTRAVLIVFL